MRGWMLSLTTVVGLALLGESAPGVELAATKRNPFTITVPVADVPDPDGPDVKAFAVTAKLTGDNQDANAATWVESATTGKIGSLEGAWQSRWNGGNAAQRWVTGSAEVKIAGDRVYILYNDRSSSYLIDARREGTDRLVGRYMNLHIPTDSTPWVGRIVDDERIDGIWTQGRWDLHRKLLTE